MRTRSAAHPILRPRAPDPDQDPNGDGKPNIHHLALNTDPLGDGSYEGKLISALHEQTGEQYLTLTLPVLDGAIFSGSDALSATVDGVVYVIGGSTSLEAMWSEEIEEVAPALDSDLPPLGDFDGE